MGLSLTESQAVTELADFLYDFLPGKPHPYADQKISFPGVALRLGLAQFWRSGSKRPAIAQLFRSTLEHKRGQFCQLIIEVVQTGMIYRINKDHPITKEDLQYLNSIIERIGFKIPELWDPAFLDTLPRDSSISQKDQDGLDQSQPDLDALRTQLLDLSKLKPQPRGYAFEKFLNNLFNEFKLEPRSPFRLVGEQIDGSFQQASHTYFVEAKWQDRSVGNNELLIFHGKVESKAKWSRGMHISYSGYSPAGLIAFARGRSTSIIGFTGQDLYCIIENEISLQRAIDLKARRAAEGGDFYVSLYDLLLE